MTPPRTQVPARRRALGQVLVAAYAVFAVAAGARAGVQILTELERAPVAYLLSAAAAAVYLVATLAFRRPGRAAFRTAVAACVFELVGVLAVGTWTVLDPGLFADETVWSVYGQGYGFVPLVLPFVGLAWLRHVEPETRPQRRPSETAGRGVTGPGDRRWPRATGRRGPRDGHIPRAGGR